ncbi:M4 family metallopeptidase [Sulfidibacter corallicola]|uniref:M4 family metallopeptidase n=1 Tax=Sulfidibacter corallicola TaxID=2818388 RepID=A0A8A4TH28_SULCO|nr:M4 family metallopeptidase [Sulfidibacter corallicola]QTD48860.1 M4 family metallopeptidase [Sulfidibacter corallicola]
MLKHATSMAVFTFLLCTSLFAAELVNLRNAEIRVNRTQLAAGELAQSLGLSQGNQLKYLRGHRTANGITHTRYRQTFQGVPIWGEQVLVATNRDGSIYALNGRMVTGLSTELRRVASLSEFDAKAALTHAKKLHHTQSLTARSYRNERSELVIYIGENGKPHLAYAVSFFSDNQTGDPTMPTYLFDAKTKEVLLSFEGLMTAEGVGPGGNQRYGRIYYGTDFDAFEVTQSGGQCRMSTATHVTKDLNHATSGGSIHTFNCNENTYKEINGAYSPLNDAHYGGGIVFQLYDEWYGTPPLTQTLELRVHYGRNYENAFWDGQAMTFGDGGNTVHPLVSLDVVGHEVSHGFTQQHSNLTYSGQSGGINEAFSDMAGKACEHFDGSRTDWDIGSRIFKQQGRAMRYMDDPTRDGVSIGCADDYYDGMDVHHSSGVFNKAYYTLANTSGWDARKAFDIFVKANQAYWTPSSNFQRGAEGALDAAKELGYNCDAVVAAFRAVCITVTAPSDCGGSGSAPTAAFDYTLDGLSVSFRDASTDDGRVVSWAWDFGDRGSSSAQNPSHTYAAAGSYTVELTVTDDEGQTDTLRKTVTVSNDPGDNIELRNGESVTVSSETDTWRWYKVDVQPNLSPLADDNLIVSTSGTNGDADIYVKYGSRPSADDSDGRSTSPDSNEEVTIPSPRSGWYYIGLHAWSAFDDLRLSASWDSGSSGSAPEAAFETRVDGRTVQFSDHSSDDGRIVSWSWDFGDGNTSSAANPQHSYREDGTFRVELTVTDDDGLRDSVSRSVTIDGGSTAPEWEPYVVYNAGDIVSYQNTDYQCLITHYAYPGWEPPNAPSLWSGL